MLIECFEAPLISIKSTTRCCTPKSYGQMLLNFSLMFAMTNNRNKQSLFNRLTQAAISNKLLVIFVRSTAAPQRRTNEKETYLRGPPGQHSAFICSWSFEAKMLAYVCLVAATLVGTSLSDNAVAERNNTPKWDSVYVDCGDHNRFVVVKNVSFSQMPVVLPGKSQVSVHLNLTNDIPDDLDVDMLMEKLSTNDQWLPVPCMFNSVGSCSLRGISACSFTYGLLGCPITKGNYEITEDLLLPFLSDRMLSAIVGEYRVSMKIRESGASEIACINLRFGIQKGSQNPHYYYEE
ncbi:hypothetical protein M514_07615 [Trichuris suis]|uniref:MD-2-related lipid-recognition domain-containing protein n=1 Tax=Trichuris suis TaxID=68888 RepID=A0A085N825_9BILA|nr:hypothetical protein M514_07615 [Trichuris suis]